MHRFIPEPDAPPPPPLDPAHSEALRRWTRELLRLDEDATITIGNVPCLDRGCPLVETTVTVFEPARTRAWTFTRPAVAVTKLMLSQTLATAPRGGVR